MSREDKIIKECAQALIMTLGSMEPQEADAVVREVATTLMNDVLGEKGYVKLSNSMIMCGDKGSKHLQEYTWKDLK